MRARRCALGRYAPLLFRFFEREATSVHSATIHPRLGLTRREQQIVPLIAQGLTNKEIANQFCLVGADGKKSSLPNEA